MNVNDSKPYLVIIESPLKGSVPNFAQTFLGKMFFLPILFEKFGRYLNRRYAKKCMRDSLNHNEAPYASHLLFDQNGLLNDANEKERRLGMECGFAWNEAAHKTIVYIDRGISSGMVEGIKNAKKSNRPITVRALTKKYKSWISFYQEAIDNPEKFSHLKDIKF